MAISISKEAIRHGEEAVASLTWPNDGQINIVHQSGLTIGSVYRKGDGTAKLSLYPTIQQQEKLAGNMAERLLDIAGDGHSAVFPRAAEALRKVGEAIVNEASSSSSEDISEAATVDWISVGEAEKQYFQDRAREVLGEREVQRLSEKNRLLVGGVRVEYCINPGTESRAAYDLIRIHGDLPVEVALAGIKHENPRKIVRDRREESQPEPGAHDGSHVPGYHAEPVQA